MRAFSGVASITIHVGLGAAVLLGPAKTGRSNPKSPDPVSIVFPQPAARTTTSGLWAPSGPATVATDLRAIRVPIFTPQPGAPTPAPFTVGSATFSAAPVSGSPPGWVAVGSESGPEVLTGPLPQYPELLRQAGVEGRVMLEAVVDTTGRVNRDSVRVVSATHPEFVRLRDRRSSPRCFGQHLFPDERCVCECEFPTTSRSETARDVPDEADVKGSSGCHRFVIFRLLASQVQRVLLVSEPVHQPGGYGGV